MKSFVAFCLFSLAAADVVPQAQPQSQPGVPAEARDSDGWTTVDAGSYSNFGGQAYEPWQPSSGSAGLSGGFGGGFNGNGISSHSGAVFGSDLVNTALSIVFGLFAFSLIMQVKAHFNLVNVIHFPLCR